MKAFNRFLATTTASNGTKVTGRGATFPEAIKDAQKQLAELHSLHSHSGGQAYATYDDDNHTLTGGGGDARTGSCGDSTQS